jgi:hypothetical protein
MARRATSKRVRARFVAGNAHTLRVAFGMMNQVIERVAYAFALIGLIQTWMFRPAGSSRRS